MHSSVRALDRACCLLTAARAFHCSRAWACAGAAHLGPSADGNYHFCVVGSGPAGFYTTAQVGRLRLTSIALCVTSAKFLLCPLSCPNDSCVKQLLNLVLIGLK